MWFIFVQLLGLIPSLIAITSLQSANRGRILTLQLLCCGMWILHYGILGAGTAVATNCIGILRALLCRYNDRPWAKSRLWLAVLMGLYLASAAVTWQGGSSVTPRTVIADIAVPPKTTFFSLYPRRGASARETAAEGGRGTEIFPFLGDPCRQKLQKNRQDCKTFPAVFSV